MACNDYYDCYDCDNNLLFFKIKDLIDKNTLK